MPLTPATHAYIGTKACGCVVAVVADTPELLRNTAQNVYSFIIEGLTVTRVPVEQVSQNLFGRCPHEHASTVDTTKHLYAVHHFVTSYVLAEDEEDAEDLMASVGDAAAPPVVYDPDEAYLQRVTTVPKADLDSYPLSDEDPPRTCREILADAELAAKQIPLTLE